MRKHSMASASASMALLSCLEIGPTFKKCSELEDVFGEKRREHMQSAYKWDKSSELFDEVSRRRAFHASNRLMAGCVDLRL